MNRTPQQLRAVGLAFIAIGAAQFVIAISTNASFYAVGIVFLVLGIVFTAQSRRAK